MTTAQRISQVQRLEDMREDAIALRNEASPGSGLYECLRDVIANIDKALDGLRPKN